jgi:hypothetical protein
VGRWQMKRFRELLSAVPKDCVVVHTDYDLFVNGPLTDLKERFLRFNRSVVLSSECGYLVRRHQSTAFLCLAVS